MKDIIVYNATAEFRDKLLPAINNKKYRVTFGEDFNNTLDLLEKLKPLALIYDIDKTEEHIEEVVNKFRTGNATPVILVGEQKNAKLLNVVLDKEIYAFINKPIDNGILDNLISDIESDFGHTYRDLIEQQSLFGVYIIQDGKFQFLNKKFVGIFGYESTELIRNRDHLDLITPMDRDFVRKHYENIVNGDMTDANFCFTARKKDKSEIELEVWCGKIMFGGRPAVQGIIADISERKAFALKEKIYEFRMMNEQKMASIGQLATGIAHNLNTPISIILSNAELLQIKYADSPELEKIIRQTERMAEIINGLLTRSKQEQIMHPQKLDLNELVANELEFLNSNLEFKHNIEKNYQLADSLPSITAIYADFSQSIMNIVQNAIDAMYQSPEKKLTVTTSSDKNFIYVQIIDTGCGIDEKEYNKLFDPFYTTKPSPLDKKDNEPTGTGLGLSTVYNLLSPYGVEIQIDSKLKKGTTVTLKIPRDLPSKDLT